jgi:hypothetical protein
VYKNRVEGWEMGALETRLPKELLERGSLRGNEYAWQVSDIPQVIEAARLAGLINVGGQLQFRIPDGGVCECYWVEVDTFKSVSADLPYQEKVSRSAEVALADLAGLASKFDFLEEGRRSFESHLKLAEENGAVLADMMCFVWYVSDDANPE